MVLVLNRTYFPEGTQGTIVWNGTLVCYTIELPWLDNQQRVSCIPEGEYVLQKQFSPKFKWHLHLQNVPGRDLILVHPANDAKRELLGCIAPVTIQTEIGKGSGSRKAMEKLKALVYKALANNEEVKIKIQSNPSILRQAQDRLAQDDKAEIKVINYECSRKNKIAHSEIFQGIAKYWFGFTIWLKQLISKKSLILVA